jgi:uncharacterized protein involved in response to NO
MFREHDLTFRLAALYAMVSAVLWMISRLTGQQMFNELNNELPAVIAGAKDLACLAGCYWTVCLVLKRAKPPQK